MKKQKSFQFGREEMTPAEREQLLKLGAAGRDSNTYGGRLAAYAIGWKEMIAKADGKSKVAWWHASHAAKIERAKKQGGRKWTYEAVQELASQCRDYFEFRRRYPNAHAAMYRNRWDGLITCN